jgi:polyisoprenyl-teichoic acid--peptidoglycan teichoic acid transferase
MDSGPPAARLRRSWPQRFLITFNCLLIAMCVMAASALGYSYYRFGNIPRVALGDILADEPPGRPQNYLLVGSDSRAFVQGEEDENSFGDESDSGGQRADTIILVRIDPRTETADMTSFPRDLWVTIAGTGGRQDRINTIEMNFDIPIHHYAQVDFKGFRELVDAVGGVDVYLDAPVRDRDASGSNVSGLDIDRTGCVTLDGDQALAYVRSRHYEEFVDGRWRPDVTGDIGRITRQQSFVATAVRQALEKGLLNPTATSPSTTSSTPTTCSIWPSASAPATPPPSRPTRCPRNRVPPPPGRQCSTCSRARPGRPSTSSGASPPPLRRARPSRPPRSR